jgi:hypothetical protein
MPSSFLAPLFALHVLGLRRSEVNDVVCEASGQESFLVFFLSP